MDEQRMLILEGPNKETYAWVDHKGNLITSVPYGVHGRDTTVAFDREDQMYERLDMILCDREGDDRGAWYKREDYMQIRIMLNDWLPQEGIYRAEPSTYNYAGLPLKAADKKRWERMIGLVIVGLAERVLL